MSIDVTSRRRSPFTRLAFDRHGRLRGWRMLGIAAGGGMVIALGTMVAVAFAGTGSPEALAYWAAGAFVVVKLPLLGLLWWLLGREQRADATDMLDIDQTRELLARLKGAAHDAAYEDDAWDRLDVLADEARYVARHAPDAVAAEASALADDLASRRDRRRPPASIAAESRR